MSKFETQAHREVGLRVQDLGAVHLLGIGGVGVSAVARLMLAAGVPVSGTDAKSLPVLEELKSAGATTYVGFDPAHLADADTVIVSSAIRPENPELEAARERGLRILHRSEGLAALMREKIGITVAGTHGKTTTSSMIATMLASLKADPSFAIGATVRGLGTNAASGAGTVFVAEADESDGSFLNYQPQIAVVTNIEPDHLDHYGTAEAVHEAFRGYARRLVPGGTLIACLDDEGAARLAEDVQRSRPGDNTLSYGFTAGAQVHLYDVEHHAAGTTVEVKTVQGVAHLDLPLPGDHNVLNAGAAIAVGLCLGYGPQECADALGGFRGAARRFDFKGNAAGVKVFDDYAHHPTEVTAAITAAKDVAGSGKVHTVFQPHLFSRTRDFARDFAAAVSLSDTVTLLPIYPAREDPIPGVTTELVAQHVDVEHAVLDANQVPARVCALASSGDVVLTLGAGDVTALGGPILDAIEQYRNGSTDL